MILKYNCAYQDTFKYKDVKYKVFSTKWDSKHYFLFHINGKREHYVLAIPIEDKKET